MSFTRCFSSLGCPDASLDEVLALAMRHDIPAVELRTLGGTADLAHYFGAKYGAPAHLAGHLPRSPVRIVAANASLHLVGTTAAERAELLALAPWADALGVSRLRVFDGGGNADTFELEQAIETIAWWRAARRSHGWRADIMVETHDSLLNAESISRFVRRVSDVAILWDAHHTWRKGREDPVATWHAIRRHVVHVHVKDSIDVPSARHPFTYVLPGSGGFPIASVLGALRADRFTGHVSLEWEKMWHADLPPLAEALRVATERGWW